MTTNLAESQISPDETSAPLEDQQDQQDDSILQLDDNSEQQNMQDAAEDLGIEADSADVEASGVLDTGVDDGLNDEEVVLAKESGESDDVYISPQVLQDEQVLSLDQEDNSYQQDEFEQQNVSALKDDNQKDEELDSDLVQQEPTDQQDTQLDSALDDSGFTQQDSSDQQNDSIQPVVDQDQQDELDRQENSARQSVALADVQPDEADLEAEAADLDASPVNEPMLDDQAASDDSSAPQQSQQDQS